MSSPDLRPQKTAMLVAQKIVADIASRGNKAGGRLPPEKSMLEEYQVGRGTLRESLRFLELQGVISLKPGPGGGPVVLEPDVSGLSTAVLLLLQLDNAPFKTIAEARLGFEPVFAELASTRIAPDDRANLIRTVSEMSRSLDDLNVFLKMNQRFHSLIAHGSGNALYGHIIDMLLRILDGSAIGVDFPVPWRETVLGAHESILDAITREDPEAASISMKEHIHGYINYAEQKFPELLEQPIVWTSMRS